MNESPPAPQDPSDEEPHPFDELEDILGDISRRLGSAPQWEYCDGFLAGLICCRREIEADEYLPVMLRAPEESPDGGESDRNCFADGAQRNRFMRLWTERFAAAEAAIELDTFQETGVEMSYQPAIADLRGLNARLPPDERAKREVDGPPAAFALPWAVGFMDVAAAWPEEWVPPRDRAMRKSADAAFEAIEALIEDDLETPTVSPFDAADPPSVGKVRFQKFAAAQLAVYDLFDIFRSAGPRIEPVRKEAQPGRNDPCWCGSGKKFKKCHGA